MVLKNKIVLLTTSTLIMVSPTVLYSKSKIDLFLSFGANHNTILKSPILMLDTVFSPSSLPGKLFPAWGYYLAILNKHNITQVENLSLKYGIEYDLHTSLYKIDSATARYYQSIFTDPAIENFHKSNTLALPLYASYKYKFMSVDFGLINTFLFWTSEEWTTLSGKTISTDNSDLIFELHSSWSFLLNAEITKDFEIQAGYDLNLYWARHTNYYRFGILYHFLK